MRDLPTEFKKKKIITHYLYLRADKSLAFAVGRTEDKEFPIYHLGPNRHWVFKAPPENLPYRLPELLNTPIEQLVCIAEGEKDVETLMKIGLTATTNRGGANASNAFKAWVDYFRGRLVIIFPDNDPAGIKHANAVKTILDPVAGECHVIHLPGLKVKGDVTDWFTEGLGNNAILHRLITQARANAVHEVNGQAAAAPSAAELDAVEAAIDNAEPDEKYDASWVPFPVKLFPVEMAEYISEVARMLSCDPGYAVMPAIVTMGSAIGNSRVCVLNEEWREPSVFWGCLVAEQSTHKSPASDMAKWPIDDLHAELVEENAKTRDDYDLELQAWKQDYKVPKKGDEDVHSVPMPIAPIDRRCKVKDITIESLAELLAGNPKGLVVICDELAGWFGSFTRYQSSGMSGSDMPFWLEVYRALSHDVDRKGGNKRSIHIAHAGVSVYGTIQEETLQDLVTPAFLTSGFLARMLFIKPPKAKKKFIEGGIDSQIKAAYRETYRKLYFIDGTDRLPRTYRPKRVVLTRKAMRVWKIFYEEWAERQHVSFGQARSVLAKLEAYCAKFALLFAMVDFVNGRTNDEEIRENHVANAFEVVRWFADEALRVYWMIETPRAELERSRLVEYIAGCENGITPRRLFVNNPTKYKSVSGATEVLETLFKLDLVSRGTVPAKSNGGTFSTVYKAW